MEGRGEVRNRKKAKNGSFSRFTFSRFLPPMHFRKEKKITFDPLEDAATVEKEKYFGKYFWEVLSPKFGNSLKEKHLHSEDASKDFFFFCHFLSLSSVKITEERKEEYIIFLPFVNTTHSAWEKNRCHWPPEPINTCRFETDCLWTTSPASFFSTFLLHVGNPRELLI